MGYLQISSCFQRPLPHEPNLQTTFSMRLLVFFAVAFGLVFALPQDPAPEPPSDPVPAPPPGDQPPPEQPPPDQPPPEQPPAPIPPPSDEPPVPAPPPTDEPQPEPEPPSTPVPNVPAPTVTGGPPGPICECGYTYCASVLQAMSESMLLFRELQGLSNILFVQRNHGRSNSYLRHTAARRMRLARIVLHAQMSSNPSSSASATMWMPSSATT